MHTKTVEEWIMLFEEFYFETRERTLTTEQTWKYEYLSTFKHLPQQEELTMELLKEAVLSTKPNTRNRRRYAIMTKSFAKFIGLETKEFDRLKGNYSGLKTAQRDLPSDDLIAKTQQEISNAQWKWAFGMLAAYGLRPHEIFHVNLEHFPVVIVERGKTGYRHIRPIYPEWATAWSLQDKQCPECWGRTNKELGSQVSKTFRRIRIPFRPYDLRHRWAVRSLEFGYSSSLAAREMGHSLQVHDAIYHRWIGMLEHDKAYSHLASRSDRPKPPI